MTRKTPYQERFWTKVQEAGAFECWPWTAAKCSSGYGNIFCDGVPKSAHRVAYELLIGEIPAGLTLDHLCHTNDPTCRGGKDCPHRACVNPWHLEPVPARVNNLRGGNAVKTHCKRGHEFTPENTESYGPGEGRTCRACRLDSVRVRAEAKRLHKAAQPVPHGYAGYVKIGCRCAVCSEAMAKARRKGWETRHVLDEALKRCHTTSAA